MTYQTWLLAHLLGVVIFLGTFLQAFVARTRSERSRQPALVAHAFASINFCDRWLMPPAVVTIVVSGWQLAKLAGWSITSTGWVFWSAVLFGASGLLFLLVEQPLQRRIESSARIREDARFNWVRHESRSRYWLLWAVLAALANLGALALMVLKPAILGV